MTQFIHSKLIEKTFADLDLIHQKNPIVHNITNLVVMQTNANVLLALGAAPIMAHAQEELAEIIAIANALVINIGTLDKNWIAAIELAQEFAIRNTKPIIFDPVGAGASQYRTHVAKNILKKGVSIIRGNASEIMALINSDMQTRGVDSLHDSNAAIECGKLLAKQYHCVVVISGKTDVIIDAQQEISLAYGSPLFTKVTGMGCSATAVIGAFAAINSNFFNAATHAMLVYTLAGQLAGAKSAGPASFYNHFLDELYQFNVTAVKNILAADCSNAI